MIDRALKRSVEHVYNENIVLRRKAILW